MDGAEHRCGVAQRRAEVVLRRSARAASDAAYDRFVHLARTYRDGGYADDAACAFLVEDPLFNAIWLWSTHALAEIAELLGEDAGRWREAAQASTER